MAIPTASEDLPGRRFDVVSQHWMQAATCHDVRTAPKNLGRSLLHIHQTDESERTFRVIEEQIDVGILAGLPPDGGAKEVQMLDPRAASIQLRAPSVPIPRSRREWCEPPDELDGNLSHDRDPALAGYRFGNQRSATSTGNASRSGARCDEAVSMPRSTRAAVTFLAPRSP
jgi:hypothetical protein